MKMQTTNERSNSPLVVVSLLCSVFAALPTFVIFLLLFPVGDALTLTGIVCVSFFLLLFTILLLGVRREEKRYEEAVETMVGDARKIFFEADCVLYPAEGTMIGGRIFCLSQKLLVITPAGKGFGAISLPWEELDHFECFPRGVTDFIMQNGARFRFAIPQAEELFAALRENGWELRTETGETPPPLDPPDEKDPE